MLQKKYRLKKYSAFIATYKNNDAISDRNLCIYFGKKKTSDDTTTKFAFVVSKKVHKRAVIRNRIKRLMREVIRKSLLESKYAHLNKYISIILVGKSSAIDASYDDIYDSIDKLLRTKGF
ncbi:ribonuclease P protein component [bacterium]|nr:ribonuclease P protein component [bacterium]